MAHVANKYLAQKGASASSESLFSGAAFILKKHRSRLSEEHFNALLVLFANSNDW